MRRLDIEVCINIPNHEIYCGGHWLHYEYCSFLNEEIPKCLVFDKELAVDFIDEEKPSEHMVFLKCEDCLHEMRVSEWRNREV